MAVLGEIGRGTTPKFVLKTLCSNVDIDAIELTIKSGAVTFLKTLKAFEAYTWHPYTGETGSNMNIHIKWAAAIPTQTSDMSDTPNKWIGISTDGNTAAPSDISMYSWYEMTGIAEPKTHLHLKWASAKPTPDTNLSDTPSDWVGIYAGPIEAAPTAMTIITGDEYRIYVDLTQEETLALSDDITYQYHYRLKNGLTNSSRIYRRAVRGLLSGRETSI